MATAHCHDGNTPTHGHGGHTVRGGRDTHTFDAAAWFAEWSDNGGIVAAIGDRLWIGRTPCLDRTAAKRLDALRGGIMHPDAATALRRVMRGNQAEVEA